MKSIKHCLAIWMLICFKAHQNLFPGGLFHGKIDGEFISAKQADSGCFNIFLKFAVFVFAQHKALYDPVDVARDVVLPPVLNGDQPLRRDGEPCFLPDLLLGVGRNGLVNVAPAADMRWSATAMSESFYLTNICPQTPSLNQGDWNRLEGKIRDWARRDSAVVIVCGPLVSVDDTTIGPNKVKVPRAFYKVVVSPYVDPPQGIGFVFENTFERRRLPLADYVVSIDSVEILTGIDFFPALPDDIENFVESRYDTEYWNF